MSLLALVVYTLPACGGGDSVEDSSASNLPATFESTTATAPTTPNVSTTANEPLIFNSHAFYDSSSALDNLQLDDSTRQHIYVAPTGSDTASGSASSPILTLQRSADLATAGTTVHIAAGSYKGPVYIKNSGTLAKPIIFEPMQGCQSYHYRHAKRG